MWKSLMIVLALIGAATTTHAFCTSATQRELKRIAKQVNSGAAIDSCVYDALEELPRSCAPSPKFLSKINKYFVKHDKTDAMHELLRRQIGAFMEICKGYFEDRVSEAVRTMDKEKLEELKDFVPDEYIGSYEDEVVDKFSASRRHLLKGLKSLIVRFLKQKKGVDLLKDNISKRQLIELINSAASDMTWPCVHYVSTMKPVMKEIRRSMVVAGNEQSYKVSSFPKEFQAAIFRYRFCEDLQSFRPKEVKKILGDLETHGIRVADLRERLAKRSGLETIGLAIGGLAILAFICIVIYIIYLRVRETLRSPNEDLERRAQLGFIL